MKRRSQHDTRVMTPPVAEAVDFSHTDTRIQTGGGGGAIEDYKEGVVDQTIIATVAKGEESSLLRQLLTFYDHVNLWKSSDFYPRESLFFFIGNKRRSKSEEL